MAQATLTIAARCIVTLAVFVLGCDSAPLFQNENFAWHRHNTEDVGYVSESEGFYNIEDDGIRGAEDDRIVFVVLQEGFGLSEGQDVVVVMEFGPDDRLIRGVAIDTSGLKYGKPYISSFARLNEEDAVMHSGHKSSVRYRGIVKRHVIMNDAPTTAPARDAFLAFEVSGGHQPKKVNEILRALQYSLAPGDDLIWKLGD